jgi:iron(III) transport system permease protein
MKIRLNSIKTYLSKPQNIILILTGILVTFTTIAPIFAIIRDTFQVHPGTIDQYLSGKASGYTFANYTDLFTSRLAKTNL